MSRRHLIVGRGVLASLLVVSLAPAAPRPRRKPARSPSGDAVVVTPRRPSQPPPPAGSRVEVVVVQIAGTSAYLQPGADGGVRAGSMATFRHKTYRVHQATDSYAVLDFGGDGLREQERGVAIAVGEDEEDGRQLPPVRPLSTWRDAWTPFAAPADKQVPARFVPLGDGVERDRKRDLRVSMAVGGNVPLGTRGAAIGRVEVNVRLHLEPFSAPFALDADVTAQRWMAADLADREGSGARPTLWVRELFASFGRGGYSAGIGRMRYAASTLGALDGARVRAPLGGGFSVGAFGGLLPDPLGGVPSTAAQRFGVEGTFARPELEWRPEASLVAHGSTFGGKLDERRLSGTFGLYPGLSRIGGRFEVSSFPAGNPWNARAVELTGAGLDASTHIGPVTLGARADLLQPERSLWLASYLPAQWFCRTIAAAPGTVSATEPCSSRVSTRFSAAVDAGLEVGPVSLVVGGSRVGDIGGGAGEPSMTGGFGAARLLRVGRVGRVEATGSYSTGSYMAMYGGSFGPGLSLLRDTLDLAAYYRFAGIRYHSVNTTVTQTGAGGGVTYFATPSLIFSAQGDMILGADVKALMVLGVATWRPRL